MENFMPSGLSEVKLNRNWSVANITAVYDNQKVPFIFIGNELRKLPAAHVIPKEHFQRINKQVRAIYDDYEKKTKLARELKKPNWTFDLEKYGIIIEKDGCLSISRWYAKKNHSRELIWQTLPEIKSAIRQQDHIIKKYLEEKNGSQNNQEVPSKFSNLFKQLHVILPHIEIRRLLLIRAQEEMDMAIQRTVKGLEILLSADGNSHEKCHGLAEKLQRLAFFLNNDWPKPYREKIDQILPSIKEAKKSAANLNWDRTKLLLLNAKNILSPVIKTSIRQSPLISISAIDPIKILAEVDKYNLAEEVMSLAKKHLPDQYLKYRGFFRLSALLAVAELVIIGKPVTQEEIYKLCR
ncbi:MAG: hypothetical protein WCT07_04045 [Candidatus Paceibacterota bacterium]